MITCEECDGKCCRYIATEIDEPETKEDWDEIKWFLYHENVVVYKDNDKEWIVEFRTRCKNLDENNQCKIYDKRPQKCRDHEAESCEVNGDGKLGDPVFRNIKDVDEYLEKQKK